MKPKILIVYIYAVGGAGGYRQKAVAFVDSYLRHSPGLDHDTLIVCNGSPVDSDTRSIFGKLPNVFYVERDDSGWDVGGYQEAAYSLSSDMMVFFGGHTYFRRSGWLARMWNVYCDYGDTLYGCTGSQGSLGAGVHPHVRTTAFWCNPALLRDYPFKVSQIGGGGERYEFEHGLKSLTNWVISCGKQPWIVGANGIVPVQQCDLLPNGFHQGDQSNVLVGDRLTAPPFHHNP